jgi:hypothetical protein
MARTTFLAAAAIALTAAACSYSETTMRPAPQPVAVVPPPAVVPAPAPSTVTYTPAATTPPAGVQAFRDEYGFRYDGQGNRLDRYGHIISPQSTTP